MHTRTSLIEDLKKAGIRQDDTLLIHSSMKQIGAVDGGPETVIDAFLEWPGKNGLIVFPSLSYTLMHIYDPESAQCRNCKAKPEVCLARNLPSEATRIFSVTDTPCCTGLLPNLFLHRPGVRRSLHMSHSLAAFGPDAEAFTAGHETGNTPCARNSPWGRLGDRNGKILMVGTNLSTCTFLHGVCEWALPVGSHAPPFACRAEVHGYDRRPIPMKEPQYKTAGYSGYFPLMEPLLEQEKILKRVVFGDASCLLLDCRRFEETTLRWLGEHPGGLG